MNLVRGVEVEVLGDGVRIKRIFKICRKGQRANVVLQDLVY